MDLKTILEMAIGGEPQPKGSMKAIPAKNKDGTLRIAMKNDNPKTKEWQDLMSFHATSEMRGALPWEGPVVINAFFKLTRPKTHFMAKGKLRNDLVVEHIDKPDLDKLIRCVLDALTGICYVDDSQVVTVSGTKSYSDFSNYPGVTLVVRGM